MGERYWISGVQIGIILAHVKGYGDVRKILNEIQDKQFIGNKHQLDMYLNRSTPRDKPKLG